MTNYGECRSSVFLADLSEADTTLCMFTCRTLFAINTAFTCFAVLLNALKLLSSLSDHHIYIPTLVDLSVTLLVVFQSITFCFKSYLCQHMVHHSSLPCNTVNHMLHFIAVSTWCGARLFFSMSLCKCDFYLNFAITFAVSSYKL